jgi:cellulose synthase operon protein YhjU
MGLWSYYFFAKLLLYFGQYIDLHVWPNLGFAAFLALPLKRRALRILRQVVAVPLGIALLYHDSWLPPPERILATGNNLQQFTFGYLMELLGRFIDLRVVGALLLTLLAWYLLSRKLRMATFAVLGIAVAPLVESMFTASATAPAPAAAAGTPGQVTAAAPEAPLTPEALNQELNTFYQQESLRKVAFPHADDSGGNYDLIYLHICSLAWDDLAYAEERSNPFLSHLDVTLSNFSSAASYSGPAAIRVLRGNCGQPKHSELYGNAAPECYIYNQVQQAGFEPEALLNHDGHFGDFLKDVREHGGFPAPMIDIRQAPVGMRAFDDSPVYDDAELLLQWWKHRLAEPAPRVALYYNTMSLHDGNRLPGQSPGSAKESYKIRAQRLFAAFQKLVDAIQASGRKAIVVMVPEHGAALRGDRMQISGLREIPTPAITLIPVGIKLVGLGAAPADAPQVVTAPSSFLAMNQVVANMLADSPFAKPQLSLAGYLKDLPQTRHEAENEGTVVMRQGSHYMMRTPDGSWSEYKVQ